MTTQFTRFEVTPINPPSVQPEYVGWYVVNPDWITLQQKATNIHHLTRVDFAYWNGAKWMYLHYVLEVDLFWFGLKEKP